MRAKNFIISQSEVLINQLKKLGVHSSGIVEKYNVGNNQEKEGKRAIAELSASLDELFEAYEKLRGKTDPDSVRAKNFIISQSEVLIRELDKLGVHSSGIVTDEMLATLTKNTETPSKLIIKTKGPATHSTHPTESTAAGVPPVTRQPEKPINVDTSSTITRKILSKVTSFFSRKSGVAPSKNPSVNALETIEDPIARAREIVTQRESAFLEGVKGLQTKEELFQYVLASNKKDNQFINFGKISKALFEAIPDVKMMLTQKEELQTSCNLLSVKIKALEEYHWITNDHMHDGKTLHNPQHQLAVASASAKVQELGMDTKKTLILLDTFRNSLRNQKDQIVSIDSIVTQKRNVYTATLEREYKDYKSKHATS